MLHTNMLTNVGVRSITTLHLHAEIFISVARRAAEREEGIVGKEGRSAGGRDAAQIPPLPRNSDRKNSVRVRTRVCVCEERSCMQTQV